MQSLTGHEDWVRDLKFAQEGEDSLVPMDTCIHSTAVDTTHTHTHTHTHTPLTHSHSSHTLTLLSHTFTHSHSSHTLTLLSHTRTHSHSSHTLTLLSHTRTHTHSHTPLPHTLLSHTLTDGGDLLLASCSQDGYIRLWRISPERREEDPGELRLSGNILSILIGQEEKKFTVTLESILMG